MAAVPLALRRLTAILTLVLLLPAAQLAAVCSGWSSAAADRHACCQQMAGCASVSADECCASSEQRRNGEPATSAVVMPGPTVAKPVAIVPPLPLSFVGDPRALAERPPVYLLGSVFLI